MIMNIGDKIAFKAGPQAEVRIGIIISIDYAPPGNNVEKLYTIYEPISDSYGLVLPSMIVDIIEFASDNTTNGAYERAMSVV